MIEKTNIVQTIAMCSLIVLIIGTSMAAPDAHGFVEIIGFGDSITSGRPYADIEGRGRNNYGGYQPFLLQLLNSAGVSAYVYNWGYGGETTPVGVNRIDSVLASQTSDYVLIMEGTNDQWYGISASTTVFNLGVMVDKCRTWGTRPILGNLTPADRDTADQIPNLYNPAITTLASQKKVRLADHYAATVDRWNELDYDDVHPNYQGYEVIAQGWFNAVIKLIKPSLNIAAIQLLLLD